MTKADRVIWLERLANRCKLHGYVEQAEQLRAKAQRLNARLPAFRRLRPDDPAFREPVETRTVSEFIRLAQDALRAL